jgi:hypothetical protein
VQENDRAYFTPRITLLQERNALHGYRPPNRAPEANWLFHKNAKRANQV